MRIVVLRKIPEEPSFLRQWDDLVLQMERPEVFYTCWVGSRRPVCLSNLAKTFAASWL